MLMSGALIRFVPLSKMSFVVGVEDVWFWITAMEGATNRIAINKGDSI